MRSALRYSGVRGWVPTASSERLGGRRRRDTEPERLLRKSLHSQGARYRLQYLIGPRGLSADIAFVTPRVAVFVDGCFWHGCPRHGRTSFRGPNAGRWAEKMARNAERDARAARTAEENGWTVLRLWECDVRSDPNASARRVIDLLAVRRTTP